MKTRTLVLICIVVLAAASRLVPAPYRIPNFAPMTMLALFCAAHFRSLWAAMLATPLAMLATDAVLELLPQLDWFGGWFHGGTGFYAGQWGVYLAYLLIAGAGLALRQRRTAINVAAVALASSLLFFFVSNFAYWTTGAYPMTWDGLLLCFDMAIPFYRVSLLSDLIFGLVLFGGFALAEHYFPALQRDEALAT
ncbi:MAG: hypothetical protein FJ271_25165 [Planctomycetes bacterium]|nr:hypothetical protein [Planctomycetota bacterium]